jgi:D-inositol-3-phosphate glycosyltransferase
LKILFCSDFACQTGFARAGHAFADRARAAGHDLAVLGVNHYGDPHGRPERVYPALKYGSKGSDFVGLSRFAELVELERPDVILIQNDPWNVHEFLNVHDKIGQESAKHGRPAPPPVVGWMPIDAPRLKSRWAAGLNRLKHAVWYSRFAQEEARKAGTTCASSVSYLGVDADVYRPLDRLACRREIGLPEDAYIVGCVNSGNPRKRLDLSVRAFARFYAMLCADGTSRAVDPYLYVHADVREWRGFDLPDYAEYLGVRSRLYMTESAGAMRGVPESDMAKVYSALDIQLSTSGGEGFGLTTLEGLACGVRQIAVNTAAIPEWAAGAVRDGHVVLVPFVDRVPTSNSIGTLAAVANVECTASALCAAADPGRQALPNSGRGPREWVLSRPELTWDRVAEVVLEEALA